MKILKFSFALFLAVTLFIACDKETTSTSIPSETELNCFGFTSSEIESIGTVQNQYLSEVYQAVDFSTCTNCRGDIIQAFKGIDADVSGLGISLDSLVNFAVTVYDSLESYDVRDWNNSPFNQATHSYLSSIMDALDQASSYQDFVNQLNSLQETARADNSLSCLDLEIVKGAIEVAKKSAYLWMPSSMGGLGINSSGDNSIEFRWDWRKAIASDVASVAADMFSMAAVLAVTTVAPPANAAIAIGIGVSAAVGSALGGL